MASLKVVLKEALEMNRAEARAAAGCSLLCEGGNHSWWRQSTLNTRSAVPRHNEINDLLVRKICSDLGIPRP